MLILIMMGNRLSNLDAKCKIQQITKNMSKKYILIMLKFMNLKEYLTEINNLVLVVRAEKKQNLNYRMRWLLTALGCGDT